MFIWSGCITNRLFESGRELLDDGADLAEGHVGVRVVGVTAPVVV